MEKLEAAEEKKDICVDTDVLVDYLRKREPGTSSYRKHMAISRISISSISAFELMYGANLSNNWAKRISEVQSLLENHFIISFDGGSAAVAGRVAADLRSRGQIIEVRDLFNASICISQGLPILTGNRKHYARISELKLISL